MLEAILKAWLSFNSVFGHWNTRLSQTIVEEQLERIHNANWSKEFLAQKKLEQQTRRSSGAPATGQPSASGRVFGRSASRRKP